MAGNGNRRSCYCWGRAEKSYMGSRGDWTNTWKRLPLTEHTNCLRLRKSPQLKTAGGWESAGEGEGKHCLSAVLVPYRPLIAIVRDRILLWTTVTFLKTLTKTCIFVKAGIFQRHTSSDKFLSRNNSQSQHSLITADQRERNWKLNLLLGK